MACELINDVLRERPEHVALVLAALAGLAACLVMLHTEARGMAPLDFLAEPEARRDAIGETEIPSGAAGVIEFTAASA